MAMISGSEVLLWDTDHSTPYRRLQLPRNSELTCTPSDEGDVYITAVSTTSVLVWNSNGGLLDSGGRSPQWQHVRAKQYPNIIEGSGWVLDTKHAGIGLRKLAWIPSDRWNRHPSASATSQSGRLFATGGNSGLITVLDVSAMVKHLAADAANMTEAVPQRDGQLGDVLDLSVPRADKRRKKLLKQNVGPYLRRRGAKSKKTSQITV
jgi:hypothetical protein